MTDDPEPPEYTTEQIEPQGKGNDGGGNGNAGGNGAGPGAGGSTPAYTPEPWPVLDDGALYGLAGEVVTCLAPHTESDPAALLLTYLTSFGNAVGRGPHYLVEDTRHFANLFVLLAGDTAKARKGTSSDRIRTIFQLADPIWAIERMQGGMSSGEGVITAVRDPQWVTRRGVEEMVDAGISDKRLLLYEPEFSSVLAVLNREGSILSRVVRDAWDCRQMLATMTKHSPTRATEAYISIVGHITIGELQRRLDETAMANGFANRFLLGCVRRARLLPHGGNFQAHERERLGRCKGGAERGPHQNPGRDDRRGARTLDGRIPRVVRERRPAHRPYDGTGRGAGDPARSDLCPARSGTRHRGGSPGAGAGAVAVLQGFFQLHLRRADRGRPRRCHPAGIAAGRCRRADEAGHLRPVRPQPASRQDRCRPGPAAGERQSRQPAAAAAGGSRSAASNVVRRRVSGSEIGYEQIGNLFVIRKGRPLFLGCIRLIPSVK